MALSTLVEHFRARSNLFDLGNLGSFFQGSGWLAYTTPVIGLVLAGIWIARLHLRLLAENRSLRARLSEADAHSQAVRNASNATQDFLTRITHEIRTPMNGIISFAALALKTELTSLQREYLDSVLTSAEWLMHVISDVLDFTRLDNSRLELDCKGFSFADCVLSAAKMVQATAQQKHLELSYRVDPRIPAVLNGDPNRLRQVLVNFLENAIRFTTNGSIMLSATVVSESALSLTVSVSVADTGIGIAPEGQARLFEPFQTPPNSHNESASGTGLGLFICKRLVEMMGGSIELQSQIGAGSTFRFTAVFQKVLAENDSPESTDVMSKLALKRLAILLIDEQVPSRRLITKLLESVGHQISPAATAGEALALFSTEIFDLVFISTDLPDMRALVLAQALRKLEDEITHTQLFLLRSENDTADSAAYTSAGMDAVVTKPVQIDYLLRVVNQACSARAALEDGIYSK